MSEQALYYISDAVSKAIDNLTQELKRTNEKLDDLLKKIDEGLTTFVEKAE